MLKRARGGLGQHAARLEWDRKLPTVNHPLRPSVVEGVTQRP